MTDDQTDQDNDPDPSPAGELILQTIALSTDTNQFGDIYGGWLAAKMDLSASIAAARVAGGTVVTVAIDNISFLSPINVGAIVGCYSQITGIGRSSVTVAVETWIRQDEEAPEWVKVSEGSFIFVAVDDKGRTRAIKKSTP